MTKKEFNENVIKAFIFDLDGVIVETSKYHYLAWKEIAQSFGFELTEALNEQLKGVSRVNSLELILSWANTDLKESTKEELLIEKNNYYLNYIKSLNPSEALEGVLELLNEIKKAGLKMGIGSASKNAVTILKKLEIVDWFDVIIDGNAVSRSKPDPEVFLKGANLMNVDPKSVIVFEDSVSGIEAANSAHFHSIGVGQQEVLHEADYVIKDFRNLNLKSILELIEGKK